MTEEPDYDRYPLSELYAIRRRIDRDAFPGRAARLDAAIERHESSARRSQERTEPARPEKTGRSTWITVVGVAGVILGLLGIGNSAQTAIVPKMMAMQKTMVSEMLEDDNAGEMGKAMDVAFGELPPWLGPASILLGILGVVIHSIYLYGAVRFLQLKTSGLRLFRNALIAAIALALLESAVFGIGFSLMGMMVVVGAVASVAIDGVLLGVTYTSDTTEFS